MSRCAAVLLFILLAGAAQGATPTWPGYGGNAQHTAISNVPAQPIADILWQTPVDLTPDYSGGDLFIHYASPMITAANTVIVPVKTGLAGGFELNAFSAPKGSAKWSLPTDFVLPPHNGIWTPSFPATLTPQNRLYFAGSGGTVYYVDSPDAPNATVTGQFAFYGLSTYLANKSFCDANYFISSPLTSDSAGNIYFSFISTNSSQNVTSGIARLAPDGTGVRISASAAANNDITILKPVYNCAPALSRDGSHLYVAVSNSTSLFATGKLVMLNANDLSYVNCVALADPKSSNPSYLPDHGTASPVIGPDDDVYFGVLENPFPENNDRGWLLHFSSDLLTAKTPGAFGWDDTPSIVPASMVTSYAGTSTYLIASKYNNYAGIGTGNGQNKIAILDPRATQTDPITGVTTMNEVLTILGATPEGGGFREWCINSAVVDPGTKSIYAGSEDGKLYQWDLTSNTFTSVVTLTPGIGEAYTPTLIGPDGTVYAINNATLFALNTAVQPAFTSSAPTATAVVGMSYSFQCTATGFPVPSFSVTSGALPDGLTVNATTGVLSGIPTKVGAFSGVLTATSASKTATQPFTIVVSPSLTTLPSGKVGTAYAQAVTTLTGLPVGAYTCVLANGSLLPAGLQLSSAGSLSGTPTASGTFAFTLNATDSTPPASDGPFTFTVPLSLTLAAPTLTLTPAVLSGANVNTPYAPQQFSASGGTAPYTFAVSGGALPPGLSLTPTGVLSGTPATEGDYTFTVSATDSTTGSGPYAVANTYTLHVDFAPVFVSPPTAANALTPGVITTVLAAKLDAQFTAVVAPADATLVWDFGDGSAGASGTPVTHRYTASGNYTVAVTATNPRTGTSTSAALEIVVTDSAALPGTEKLLMRSGKITLSTGQNNIKLQTALSLQQNEPIAHATLTVNINGVTRTFTFDAKGRAQTKGGSAHLAFKTAKGSIPAQTATLTLSLSGPDIAAGLKSGVATDAQGNAAMAAVELEFNGAILTYVTPLQWKKTSQTLTTQLSGK